MRRPPAILTEHPDPTRPAPSCLVEGMSIRGAVRITGAAKNTVTKLLVDLGEVCGEYQDRSLVDLPCETIQCDEIWNFVYSKQKNVPEQHKGKFGYGNVWTWTAICSDTKLIPSWFVGQRNAEDGFLFMMDLKHRLRDSHVQLTTVGFSFGMEAIGRCCRSTTARTRPRNAATALASAPAMTST
jgi:hypothetical protein